MAWAAAGPGRPSVLIPAQVAYVIRAYRRRVPISVIARNLGCGRATVYRVLSRAAAQ